MKVKIDVRGEIMAKSVSLKKRYDVDMTQGGILRHLVIFSLPLLAGNIFQQLYNMVDAWVVGNFVSDSAFSAVGMVGTVINVLIGFFMGLSNGAGVLISQYYGAKQYAKVHDTVHTAIVMTLILGVIFTILGIAMVPFVLNLIMKMPENVYPQGKAYLTIYFAGVIGLMIYNMCSSILRSVGDSKRSFYFLVISAVVNTVLDLVFVLVFKMGVEGVAYATIIAQFISAVLSMMALVKSDTCIVLVFKDLRINFDELKKIFSIGFPSAIQLAITAFSNVFVYSYINYFGSDMAGGWTAYSKIDQFIMLPLQSISIAITTFVGQNYGKNDIPRARKGVRVAFLLAFGISAFLMIPELVFSPYLVRFFNSKPEVIEYGTLLIRWITPFFLLNSVTQILSGALRGTGNTKAPMIIMLTSFVGFRQCYLYIMSNFISNTEIPIAMAFPAGWMMCACLTFIYYMKVGFSQKRNIV